jgi:hypothetical protein
MGWRYRRPFRALKTIGAPWRHIAHPVARCCELPESACPERRGQFEGAVKAGIPSGKATSTLPVNLLTIPALAKITDVFWFAFCRQLASGLKWDLLLELDRSDHLHEFSFMLHPIIFRYISFN